MMKRYLVAILLALILPLVVLSSYRYFRTGPKYTEFEVWEAKINKVQKENDRLDKVRENLEKEVIPTYKAALAQKEATDRMMCRENEISVVLDDLKNRVQASGLELQTYSAAHPPYQSKTTNYSPVKFVVETKYREGQKLRPSSEFLNLLGRLRDYQRLIVSDKLVLTAKPQGGTATLEFKGFVPVDAD